MLSDVLNYSYLKLTLPKEKDEHLYSIIPVEVRKEPKIDRNEICPKYDSGKEV